MSFEQKEESRFEGEPVDLFLFRYGTEPNAFYAYTDAEQEITHEGVVYTPVPAMRGNIQSSGTLDKAILKVNMPINTGLADLFRVYPPGQVVSLTIRQGHVSDIAQEFLAIWVGRVIQAEREGYEAIFSCEPFSTSMRRTGLRRHYQYGCPHVLYSQGTGECKANKAAATIPVTTVSVGAATVTLPDAWNAQPVVKYIGGMIEWAVFGGLERRTILRITDGKTLHLSGPTTELAGGVEIDVILGCNHQPGVTDAIGDCTNLHDNILNYGGQPWIPTKNPVNTNPFS